MNRLKIEDKIAKNVSKMIFDLIEDNDNAKGDITKASLNICHSLVLSASRLNGMSIDMQNKIENMIICIVKMFTNHVKDEKDALNNLLEKVEE